MTIAVSADDEPPEPVCEKCGAPITTGLMALLCPGRQECAMWPDDPDIEDNTFVKMFPDEYTPEQKARWRELCDERAASSAFPVNEFPQGAVSVLNPQGTEETGNDRPAAPILGSASETVNGVDT